MQLQANQQLTLERLELRLCTDEDRKRRMEEMGKSKVTAEDESPDAEPVLVGSVPLSVGGSRSGTSSTPQRLPINEERRRRPSLVVKMTSAEIASGD